jgi:hypothetical protein
MHNTKHQAPSTNKTTPRQSLVVENFKTARQLSLFVAAALLLHITHYTATLAAVRKKNEEVNNKSTSYS